jgi:hypothetical protein
MKRMKLETQFRADRKVTILFVIVTAAGISLAVANRHKTTGAAGVKSVMDHSGADTNSTAVSGGFPSGVDTSAVHGSWGRDPFLRAGSQAAGRARTDTAGSKKRRTPRFELTAVLIDGDTGAAVINGEVCRRGCVIQGYTVERISPGRVTLTKGQKTIALKLQ